MPCKQKRWAQLLEAELTRKLLRVKFTDSELKFNLEFVLGCSKAG